MTPFALPYNPADAPLLDLIGIGYRPAWRPADYIGPRLDCPMWLPGPDADLPYSAKYDGPIDPFMPAPGESVVVLAMGGRSSGGGVSGHWSPPLYPDWPTITHPCCGEPWAPPHRPEPPLVPIEAGAGQLLLVALVILAMSRALCRWADVYEETKTRVGG